MGDQVGLRGMQQLMNNRAAGAEVSATVTEAEEPNATLFYTGNCMLPCQNFVKMALDISDSLGLLKHASNTSCYCTTGA